MTSGQSAQKGHRCNMRDKRLGNRPTERAEMILVRVGHHLWRWYKQGQRSHGGEEYLKCCQIVWNLKEELRVGLRGKWLESCKKRAATLAVVRQAKAR